MRSIQLKTLVPALALVAVAYLFLPSLASADHCGPLCRLGGAAATAPARVVHRLRDREHKPVLAVLGRLFGK